MVRPRVLYWFRTDLRLHDSPALHAALDLNPEVLYPVWCWDPEYVFGHRVGANRFNFLIESMNDLDRSLTKLNKASKLLVLRGSPYTILPALWKHWGITHIVFEKDTGGYAQVRDRKALEMASQARVDSVVVVGHSLYDPELVIKRNGGKPTTTLNQWQKASGKLGSVPRPLSSPMSIPPPGDLDISNLDRGDHLVGQTTDLNYSTRTDVVTCFDTLIGSENDFCIPTMKELGYPHSTTSILGGESEGLRKLVNYNADVVRVATFEKPKTSPCEDDPPSTTQLSPYFKFGCLSVRKAYWAWKDIIDSAQKAAKKPENLLGQLEFRDMYYAAELAVGGETFSRVRGNPIAKFINWNCANVYDDEGNEVIPRPRDTKHEKAEKYLEAWRDGQTGFPWIDALMRQLKQEGWMHHLGRHSVACFLTRGQCYVSWERGAEVFDEYLIDWDPASNYGNWMWLSCTAFFSQFYRVYGVVTWPSNFDKTGKLVRKYVPELKGFPDKYIYEPHKAPLSVQKAANCFIGSSPDCGYPLRVLDEKAEKANCLMRMKVAYQVGLYGDSKDVLEGRADKRLADMMKERSSDGSVEGSKRKDVGTKEDGASKKAKTIGDYMIKK